MNIWRERNKWSIGVFGAIFKGGNLLLVRAKNQDKWSLPGGGVSKKDIEDTLSNRAKNGVFALTLLRELEEEIGFSGTVEFGTKGIFESCKLQDIALVILLKIPEDQLKDLQPGNEIVEVGFFEMRKIPPLLGARMQKMVSFAFEQRALGF